MPTPASLFSHGYALLIGVDDQADASLKRYALPGVKNDIQRLADTLTHPARCGYPPEQVSILLGAEATKSNIRKAIKTLGEQVAQGDPGNATVAIYFSGHGLSTTFASEPDGSGEPDEETPPEDGDGEDGEKITPPPKEDPKPIGSKRLPVGPPADEEGSEEESPDEAEEDGSQ